MNEQQFYETVGKMNGWDFSQVRSKTEGEQWDFYDEVARSSSGLEVLLDIGTGGGEKVMEIASSFTSIVAIDQSKAMIETAKANQEKSFIENLHFLQASAENLPFPDGRFDLASSRHAPFSASEVWRVLKENGIFFSQQVSEADKLNLKTAFGRGQSFDDTDGTLCEKYTKELTAAGFSKVEVFEYDAVEYFERPEDLIFLLTHTPIIPSFGEQEDDFEILQKFIADNQTEKGIKTNSKRFLLIAKK